MDAVPMFPLGSVLFPHTPLVLRIFEPRYLTMLGRLLDEDDPEFGVVLIARGHEAGGGDQRNTVGTMARIVQVQVGADDLHLVAVGRERFAVDRWLADDPHPVAELTPLPALTWNDDLAPLRAEAERIVRRVLARAAEQGDTRWQPEVELSEDPVEAAWQLAAIAPLGDFDRYRLLRATTVGGLLRETIDLTLDIEPLLSAPTDPDELPD
ncbi:LON peptidase substrate-binding domain-containing protein [Microbacterium sp. HJ5]